jgi:exosome complex exonuclease DIS3/RRP44
MSGSFEFPAIIERVLGRSGTACFTYKACRRSACLPYQQKTSFGIAKGRIGPTERVLILDASAILRQMDIFDSGLEGVTELLFLQTVLREVRRRSADAYNRVTSLLVSPKDTVCTAIFSNENRSATYVERSMIGENESAYDLKSIVAAFKWLKSHWETLGMAPTLVTDRALGAAAYREAGVEVMTVRELLKKHPLLADLYADVEEDEDGIADPAMDIELRDGAKLDEDTSNRRKHVFPDYISDLRVRGGVKSGKYFKGTFRPSPYNVLEAYISANIDPSDKMVRTKILIAGRENQNRAIDGDIVVIELLPKAQWRRPSNKAVEQEDIDVESEDEEEVTSKDSIVKSTARGEGKQQSSTHESIPTGRVVAIARRSWRPYCGTISGASHKGGDRALFVPADRKVPKIRIHSRRIPELLGQRLIVIVDKWERGSFHPSGHVIKEIGNSGDKEAETEVILVEYGIPTRKFSDAAMACLPGADFVVTEEHVRSRWDLRHDWTVCSVDPPGCTDIDDALHFRRLNENEVEIGVHIADVTAFVAHDSALDREAAERGTTVYLVDRRIEMLPSLLSGNLCSLRPNVDRLAFSAMIRMTNDGTVLAAEFGRSVIKSSAALTYQEAQERIDASRARPSNDRNVTVDRITENLLGLAGIAKHLRERRMAAGALTLASPEVRFKISELTDSVTDATVYEIRETNKMVEEFMLLANIVVAERILKHFPHCALLRRHPKPSTEMFEPLIAAAASGGYSLDVSNSRFLNDSLARIDEEAKSKGDDYLGTLLRIMATRCMTQAVYFSSGEVADPEYLHYGLAAPVYTHFTSPIRRYADVLVHRLLSACLGFASLPMALQDSKRMNELADVINERHHCAQFAARSSTALHTVLLFKDRDTLTEAARIVKVLDNGLVVLVPRYGVEGIVHVDDDRSPHLDDVQQVLRTNDGKSYKILQTVRVQIRVDSAPERRDRVLYELVE